MRSYLFTFLCAVVFPAVAGAEPPTLQVIDPLSRPAPRLERTLAFAQDERPADRKVTPSLLAKAIRQPQGAILEVIVTLHEPSIVPLSAEMAEDLRLERIAWLEHELVRRAPASFSARQGLSHFPIVFGEVLANELLALASLPEVLGIEEVRQFRALRVEGGGLMKSPQLQSQFNGRGNGIGVAVLDTGIDYLHPEFGSRVVAQYDATGTSGTGVVDEDGHGTAGAGIIAGSGGMAPEATLWAIKVLDADGNGNSAWTVAGLNSIYAGRNDFGGLDLVNMSLGGLQGFSSDCDGESPSYTQVVNALTSAGIAVFAAAGNEGIANGISLPGCLSKVISVGAVYDANIGPAGFDNCDDPATAADQVTCYSNSGAPLDILAPSHCARTPKTGGGYESCFGGTSAASPYAAGAAAQILSVRPGTTPSALQNALMTSGKPIADPFTGLVRNRVDAVAAYQKLGGGGTGPCVASSTAMCLAGNRFKVQATYNTGAQSGQAAMVKLTDDSGYFWFFNAANIEAVIKVLNACGLGGKFWVFAGGLTNVEVVITVTDTQTGAFRTYTNPRGQAFQPLQDTAAFSTCP